MKIVQIILLLLVVVLIGGFGYFAITDIDVAQKQTIKPISNDRFFGSS